MLRRAIDRRSFLRVSGALAASAALPACGDDWPPLAGGVFEVDATSAIVWAGGAPGELVELSLFARDGGDHVLVGEARVELAADSGTAAVAFTGLAPATPHVAKLVGPGATGEPFAFVTAPADDDERAVRLAWSADLDLDPAYASPILDAAIGVAPDAFVSLGDWPYADNGPVALTLADYRDRHRRARADAGTQRWMQTTSFRCIYDDHEVRNDWDLGSWAREPDRHLAGLRAWDDYFPVRTATADVRYRRWRWGAHVEAFLLDTRRHRAPLADPDVAGKTMLGDAQRAWLVAGVLASRARYKLVFTTVPLDYGWGGDHWAAYTWERDTILDALAAGGATGVLFLCGDSHFFASHRVGRGAREYQAGPLARGVPDLAPFGGGELARVMTYNLGVLDVDRAGTLTVRCVDATGATRFSETLTPADLALR